MLKPLTSLRFFAAFAVFLTHQQLTQSFAQRYFLGYFGVGFFFVLSGFILMYCYHDEFATGVPSGALRSFWGARFARVYPVHALTLGIFAVIILVVRLPWSTSNFVLQVLLLQAWSRDASVLASFNPVAWTLSCEAFFYAVFPLATWAIGALSARTPRFTLLVAALSLLAGGFLVARQSSFFLAYTFPPMRLVDFFFGILVGAVFLRSKPAESKSIATIAEVTILAVIALAVLASPSVSPAVRAGCYLMPVWGATIYVFGRNRGIISALLEKPALVYLGEISFGFYMLHLLITLIIEGIAHGRVPAPLLLMLTFSASVVCSIAVFERFERPMRSFIRRRVATWHV
jgi:peptidoglycan/LPS O-acetylase OafA/YrhL